MAFSIVVTAADDSEAKTIKHWMTGAEGCNGTQDDGLILRFGFESAELRDAAMSQLKYELDGAFQSEIEPLNESLITHKLLKPL